MSINVRRYANGMHAFVEALAFSYSNRVEDHASFARSFLPLGIGSCLTCWKSFVEY